jgi:heat shock protein HslJ
MKLRSYMLMGLGLALLAAPAVQAQQTPPGRDLTRHEWRLDSMTGGSTSLRARPTLSFRAPDRLSGFTGCNRLSGSWSSSGGGQLSLNRMSPARHFCSHSLMIQETRFLGALQTVNAYAVRPDGRLELTNGGGQKLVFH